MAPTPGSAPYMLQDLVDSLPLDTPERNDVVITCLESWGTYLYVGTSAHEILHLVSIPSTPNPENPKPAYILATRIQPLAGSHAAGSSPFIKNILVLPTVSKALVLSSTGLLTFYTLPEFSPAFSNQKLNNVSFIGGLDLNEEKGPGEEQPDKKGKLIMVLTKKIRMIRISDQVRLVNDIPLPSYLNAVRRGTIACVANSQNYDLLDTEGLQRISLFPIASTSDSPDAPFPEPEISAYEAHTGAAAPGEPSEHHPQRTSSLVTSARERRNSSATSAKEGSGAAGHSRSVSAGNLGRRQSHSSPRPASRLSHLALPEPNRPRSVSPGSPTSPTSASKAVSSGRGSPASRGPSPALQPPKRSSVAVPRVALKPHIASPSPEEFLLTTGTRPEDPGVGMFVNTDGDVTRGTIQFERYPDQLIVDDGWVIAVIPGKGLEMQRWDMEVDKFLEEVDHKGTIPFEEAVQLKKVLGLEGTIVAEVGRALRFSRVPLRPKDEGAEEMESSEDRRRDEEERVIAQRISTVGSRVLAFSGRKVWTLLLRPLSILLDSRLPKFSDKNFDGIVARVRRVLNVLEEVQSIEPDSETSFHEVAFVRQKCGLLVLGELLRITQKQTSDLAPDEILKVEDALFTSALDPRFIVALFGDLFQEDIVEGSGGVWVYGGVKEVFTSLKESKQVGSAFTRDVLLLLKRFLAEWRRKKGFGSVADEKEVFLTVDAALLRVLLMLDSPEYLIDKGKTVVQEGNVRSELHSFIGAGVENIDGAARILESFGRLYVLSTLYSRAKMYRNVLETWKRILEEGDSTMEFENGEERTKNFLLKMRDAGLVAEFGCWLAARNSKLGIQVFSSEEARIKFDPSKVLEMLREHAPDAVRAYVEHLVVEKKNSQYANELIFLYLDDLINTLSTDPSAAESLQTSYESYCALECPKPTYRDFIIDNSPPAAAAPWWHNRMRLLELLGGESGYDVNKVFAIVEKHRDALVPEMVILYGRGAKHADALKLLTHHLKDFDTAINYCLFGGLSIFQTRNIVTEREEQCELFTILLDEYLKLQDLSERIEQTGQLLDKFGRWLDVTYVLGVIPDSWSIEILSGFLIGALRQLVREKAEVRVERALGRSKNLRVEAAFVAQCDEIGPTVDMGN